MGTLSGLLDLSRSALTADQAALTATSNNVANQNTVGYTRQVVSFASGASLTLSGGPQGVNVTTTSMRNRVLEQRVQGATQDQTSSAARAEVYSSVEDVFSISGSSSAAGSTQVGSALDSFFSSLSSLATSPNNTATRAGVLSAATALASAFNSGATQLAGVQTTINGELKTSVAAVNTLTGTIASLNKSIAANSPDADAGSLENQRQQAIAQLSQYVGLSQTTTEGNGITLTTTGGAVLVSGGQASELSAANVGGTTEVRDASGADVSGSITGGSVGGQLQAQNKDLPAVTRALDAVAFRIANAVNAQNEAGLDATGAAGKAIFAVTASATDGAAGAIAVLASGGSAIAAAATGEGTLGNTNANALAGLANATDASGATIGGQFAGFIGDIGTNSSAVQEQSLVQAATLTQLTTQRDSLSGVSLDEEAANLTQYQRAYEAAAKVFSVVDSLLTASINLGVETTYS